MSDVILHSTEGRLEGRYFAAPQKGAPIALICHPHPLYGGTMNNKVVYTLYKAFAEMGFSVLRFNFRGVGHSEGTYDNGEGETNDAAYALEWLESMNEGHGGCYIAGFSFGAWIALQLLMRRPETTRFIAVSPPAHKYDFGFLLPCPTSGLIIQGDKDETVPEESVHQFANKLSLQHDITVDYKVVPNADHFFTNQLDDFAKEIKSYLAKCLEEEAEF